MTRGIPIRVSRRMRSGLALLLALWSINVVLGGPARAAEADDTASISGALAWPPGAVVVVRAQDIDRPWSDYRYGVIDQVAGSYTISGLPSGRYRVCAFGEDVVKTCWGGDHREASAAPIVLQPGEARTGIDLVLELAGSIEGVIDNVYLGAEGEPLVSVWRGDGPHWERYESGEPALPSQTDPSVWTYHHRSLPAGVYRVCVEHHDPEFVPGFAFECHGGTPSPRSGDDVHVVAGQATTGVDFTVDDPSSIRGRALNSTGPVEVDLFHGHRLALTATSNEQGVYRFLALPAGEYVVRFRPSVASRQAVGYHRNRLESGGVDGATTVALVGGTHLTGINTTLQTGGSITGRLVDSERNGVGGCALSARAPDGSLTTRTAVTLPNGRFDIGGLTTAGYHLVVPARCSGTGRAMRYYAPSPTRTSARLRDADSIAVAVGNVTALPLRLVTGTPWLRATTKPTIIGTPQVGRTLRAQRGSWVPEGGVGFTYRWFASGAVIPGATTRMLELKPEHAGKYLRVEVTAAANGWRATSVRAVRVGPVQPAG